MPGLPPVEERTLRAVCERALADSPDEIAQADESWDREAAGIVLRRGSR
jgi:hypothetical protein